MSTDEIHELVFVYQIDDDIGERTIPIIETYHSYNRNNLIIKLGLLLNEYITDEVIQDLKKDESRKQYVGDDNLLVYTLPGEFIRKLDEDCAHLEYENALYEIYQKVARGRYIPYKFYYDFKTVDFLEHSKGFYKKKQKLT